ncbi:MAG: endonuclease III [Ruminococcaceae bacterium]|nr:endonuclease III [Oscillospiraceae bacterium]
MTDAQKRRRMREIVAALEEMYPDATCALEYGGEPWRLMVMARLSAQCTDARVNEVCRELFDRFPTLDAMADAPLSEIAEIIRPCGLWQKKSENIKNECIIVRDRFGGVLPDNMEDLLSLPGVGRKIANLLLGDIYKKPAIVADTHCMRICGRFGMYPEGVRDAHKVEKIMSALVEPEKQSDFCHRIVQFGRDVCTARSPMCKDCPIRALCAHGLTKNT